MIAWRRRTAEFRNWELWCSSFYLVLHLFFFLFSFSSLSIRATSFFSFSRTSFPFVRGFLSFFFSTIRLLTDQRLENREEREKEGERRSKEKGDCREIRKRNGKEKKKTYLPSAPYFHSYNSSNSSAILFDSLSNALGCWARASIPSFVPAIVPRNWTISFLNSTASTLSHLGSPVVDPGVSANTLVMEAKRLDSFCRWAASLLPRGPKDWLVTLVQRIDAMRRICWIGCAGFNRIRGKSERTLCQNLRSVSGRELDQARYQISYHTFSHAFPFQPFPKLCFPRAQGRR